MNYVRKSGAIIVIIIFLLTSHLYFKPKTGIYDYNKKRDREFILQLFKKNWHWLISEYTKNFSPEYMLDNKASSKDASKKGNLSIKVYLDNGEPAGFIAYYKKKVFLGYILFLAVDKKFRKKGYAEKLLKYALKDLKNRGCSKAALITRTTNQPAINLYKKIGFYELSKNQKFIDFAIKLK